MGAGYQHTSNIFPSGGQPSSTDVKWSPIPSTPHDPTTCRRSPTDGHASIRSGAALWRHAIEAALPLYTISEGAVQDRRGGRALGHFRPPQGCLGRHPIAHHRAPTTRVRIRRRRAKQAQSLPRGFPGSNPGVSLGFSSPSPQLLPTQFCKLLPVRVQMTPHVQHVFEPASDAPR